jgi:uncharacterized membrane protein YfcA
VTPLEATALLGGGLAAGVVNTLAGGGSLLSVPLLVLIGLPGTVANGTNRIGVLLQSGVAALRFRAAGVSRLRAAAPVLISVGLGSLAGAFTVSRLDDALFERLFGVLMLLVLVPTLRPPRTSSAASERSPSPSWGHQLAFFGIGLYGGAFQAGVGLLLVVALSHAGYDLVRANAIKVSVNFVLVLVAIPVFVLAGQIAWLPALLLGAGFAVGGEIGARLAVRGGERLIRPVLALAVVALAGRMLGLW